MSAVPRVAINAADAVQWMLQAAVMIYRSHDGAAYATVHGIESGGKQMRLGAGQPATKEACADLARALGAMSGLCGFTPTHLLYLGARSLIWWRPPAPARMFFEATADRKDSLKGSAVTPQPGLVFAVGASDWYVYALDGAERPGPATKLLQAPYFNVWEGGRICTGNVKLPQTLSPAALAEYERAFFGSSFTHPNVKRLVRGGKGTDFWRDGLKGRWGKAFPTHVLLPTELTLQKLAKALDNPKEKQRG